MAQLNYIPVHFALFLILGVIFGSIFDFPIHTVFVFSLLNFLGLIFFFFKAEKSFHFPLGFFVFTATLFICIGILGMSLTKPKNQKDHYSHFLKGRNSSIIKIQKILKSNNYFLRMEAEVLQLDDLRTKGKILLQVERNKLPMEFQVDDIIFSSNEFSKVKGALNPYEFNYRNYLEKQNIYHQLVLKKEEFSLLKKKEKTLFGVAHSLREKINTELKTHDFSKDELSIYDAILLGQRQDISKENFEMYKNAGAIHILAVSGLHIGIILIILNFLFQPIERLKKGKMMKLVFVILFLWAYAFLVGLSASVIRAVTMFSAIAIGLVLNRPSGVKNSLVLSLFILLLWHPLFLFDVGFQLSYAAVFSIVWLQPFFSKLWKPKHKVVHYFWQLLTVSFAAQIGVLPLSLFYFHQFPGLFFVSSLMIIPVLGMLLGIGFLVAILALLDFLPKQLVYFYEILLKSMNKIVALISNQEAFLFEDISFSKILMVSAYLLLFFTMNFLQHKNIKNGFLFLSAVLFLQVSMLYERIKKQEKNEFVVFQETANSVFMHRKNEKVIVYENSKTLNRSISRPVKSYVLGNNLDISERKPIKNYFKSEKTTILIIDSLGIYHPLKIHPEMVILTQSPKINLDRLIKIIQPKIIIADGSNYKSYVNRWQKTCEKEQINFYDTSKMGAFVTNY